MESFEPLFDCIKAMYKIVTSCKGNDEIWMAFMSRFCLELNRVRTMPLIIDVNAPTLW
jgi:hypothetical protein